MSLVFVYIYNIYIYKYVYVFVLYGGLGFMRQRLYGVKR